MKQKEDIVGNQGNPYPQKESKQGEPTKEKAGTKREEGKESRIHTNNRFPTFFSSPLVRLPDQPHSPPASKIRLEKLPEQKDLTIPLRRRWTIGLHHAHCGLRVLSQSLAGRSTIT